jgi:thiol-disulfide isomerase/thioredoxin
MNQPAKSVDAALRRKVLIGAGIIGATAFVGGAAVGFWDSKQKQAKAEKAGKSAERLAKLQQSASSALWMAEFESSDGSPATLDAAAGQILLVNFWATWCPPCVEELPMLSRFHEDQKALMLAGKPGAQLVAVAADKRSNVLNFVQKSPISGQVLIAGAAAIEMSKALGNVAGGLPFTLLLARDGSVAVRKLGQVKPADLQAWAGVIAGL